MLQEELGKPRYCYLTLSVVSLFVAFSKSSLTHVSEPQNTHKEIHKQENSIVERFFPPKVVSKPDPETGYYNPFPTFNFTGPLRPVYPLSPRRTVPKSIPHPDWWEDGIPKYGGRAYTRPNKIEQLDAKGQEGMRKVCRLAREVLDIAAAALRPGITTDEIDEIVHNACIERNVRVPYLVKTSSCADAIRTSLTRHP